MASPLPSSNLNMDFEVTSVVVKDNIVTMNILIKNILAKYITTTYNFSNTVYYICF